MYHKTLTIALIGLSNDAADTLAVCSPLERFSHDVRRFEVINAESFVTSDVVIIDVEHLAGSFAQQLGPLVARRHAERGPRFGAVVALASPAHTASWTADDYALFDAVWPSPLDPTRATFEFTRLQRAAQQAAELHLARTYLDTAINSIPELIWFKDTRGAHLKVNDAFCTTVEKTKEQVEGRGHYYIWDITPEEYASGEFVCLESEDETIAAGRTCLFDEQVKTTRGMRQFKTYKSPLFDEDGTVMGTVGIAHDVTDLGNIATELDILTNALPFSVIVEDVDGTILNANRQTERYFGIDRDEMIGTTITRWRHRVFGNELARRREQHEDPEFTAFIDGKAKTLVMTKAPIVDVFGNQTGQLRIYRDVTSERNLEQRALRNARTDYLTGLFNRRYFYEYLNEHDPQEPLAIVALDLDDFKTVNDRYGHATGDEVLLKAGALLREAFPDGLAIRWGGDEFIAAVFGERPMEDVRARALHLLEQLAVESEADGAPQVVTGSVGIAATDDPTLSIDELIKRSDAALYRAKREGKSRCCVYEEDE